MERILTVDQMKFCEQKSAETGVSLAQLMASAGERLAEHILSVCKEKMTKNVVILAGKGNNGGDGLVAANILYESGVTPTVLLCCGMPATDLSKAAYKRLHKGIPKAEYVRETHSGLIKQADMIADCIFGTGFAGEIRDDMRPLFEDIAASNAFKIACDIPSGVNARSGEVSQGSVKADTTVTFHCKKTGMVLSPGKYFCGNITVCEIGIPETEELLGDPRLADVITVQDGMGHMRSLLPEREPWGHKGTFGKLISVCGSESYVGAAGISALSALRTGVGLVELCTPKAVIGSLSSNIPECVYSAMKTDSEGFMTSENAEKILEKCRSAQCLLIGCGLGHTFETERLTAELAKNAEIPIIIDADGINSLCPNIDVLLKRRSETVILTPHPAELARLCGVTLHEILSDRYRYASELSKKYGVIVVSKGAETMICSGGITQLICAGNTALAKGGSGDMLAGIISSLTAQAPGNAANNALLGCYIMGKTAEMLSEERSCRGILAHDIINALPYFLKKLEDTEK